MAITNITRGQNGSDSLNDGLVTELNAGQATIATAYTVATAPAAASHTGRIIYVSDGATGSPCLAYSNGTNWLRITIGAAIAAS